MKNVISCRLQQEWPYLNLNLKTGSRTWVSFLICHRMSLWARIKFIFSLYFARICLKSSRPSRMKWIKSRLSVSLSGSACFNTITTKVWVRGHSKCRGDRFDQSHAVKDSWFNRSDVTTSGVCFTTLKMWARDFQIFVHDIEFGLKGLLHHHGVDGEMNGAST